MTPLRVMTVNLRYDNPTDGPNQWCFRKKSLATLIEEINPDVFGSQEGWEEQLNELKTLLPQYKYYVSAPEWNRKRMFPCVWVRKDIDIRESNTLWLSPTPVIPFSKVSGSIFPRSTTYVIAKKDNCPFLFVNTHLDLASEEVRLNQTIILLREIEKINHKFYPVILVGDFNTTPTSPIYTVLTEKFIDVWKYLETSEEDTFHGFTGKGMRGRIDWILVSSEVIIKKAKILKQTPFSIYPSDHFPVMAELELL